MASGTTETEIKLPVSDLDTVRGQLLELSFTVKTPRTFESNDVFDTLGNALRSKGCLLRLREYGEELSMTYKGPGQIGRHKVREELETKIGSMTMMRRILEQLGFRVGFRYEKYRSEYTDGNGVAVLDETPIGNYLELEGEATWIDHIATSLGYGEEQYITRSYGTLYKEYCANHPGAPIHMIFS